MFHLMFDIDGTLIQSVDFDHQCYQAAIKKVTGQCLSKPSGAYRHVSDTGILMEHLAELKLTDRSRLIADVKQAFLANLKNYFSQQRAQPITGANTLIETLQCHPDVSLSLATGGWRESAEMKLKSAEIDVSNIPLASADDHHSRVQIMRTALARSGYPNAVSVTYIGDGPWDKAASAELKYRFILIGDRVQHLPAFHDFANLKQVLTQLLG